MLEVASCRDGEDSKPLAAKLTGNTESYIRARHCLECSVTCDSPRIYVSSENKRPLSRRNRNRSHRVSVLLDQDVGCSERPKTVLWQFRSRARKIGSVEHSKGTHCLSITQLFKTSVKCRSCLWKLSFKDLLNIYLFYPRLGFSNCQKHPWLHIALSLNGLPSVRLLTTIRILVTSDPPIRSTHHLSSPTRQRPKC